MATRFILVLLIMESLLSAMADSCVDFMFVGSRSGDFEGINEAVGVNEAHSVMMEVRVLRDIVMVKESSVTRLSVGNWEKGGWIFR